MSQSCFLLFADWIKHFSARLLSDYYSANRETRHCTQGFGWQSFKGDVLVMQPRGQVRFDVLDPYVFALRIAPGTGVPATSVSLTWRT